MRREMTGFWDGSGISWTICKQSALRSRQIATPTPHHSFFMDKMLFLMPNQQCQSTEGNTENCLISKNHYLLEFSLTATLVKMLSTINLLAQWTFKRWHTWTVIQSEPPSLRPYAKYLPSSENAVVLMEIMPSGDSLLGSINSLASESRLDCL